MYITYGDYEEFEDYDLQVRYKMIGKFMREGLACMKGFRYWIENEMNENEKRLMGYKAEKDKNVVDVEYDDEGCSSFSSEAARQSPDSPLVVGPLGCRASTSYEAATVPFLWVPHPRKKRIVSPGYHKVEHQERTKKSPPIMMIKRKMPVDGKPKKIYKKMKKEKRKISVPSLPSPPQEMPNELQQAITKFEGTTPMWMTGKTLTDSDTAPQQSRIFLLNCEALKEFLTAKEKKDVVIVNKIGGLNVLVVDKEGREFDIDLKYWPSLNVYVLTKNWKLMVKEMNLRADLDTVQLWVFRLPEDSKICIAINVVRTPETEVDEPEAGSS